MESRLVLSCNTFRVSVRICLKNVKSDWIVNVVREKKTPSMFLFLFVQKFNPWADFRCHFFAWISVSQSYLFFCFNKNPKKIDWIHELFISESPTDFPVLTSIQCMTQLHESMFMLLLLLFFFFFFFCFLKCIFILHNYSGSLILYTRVTYTEKKPRKITEKNKKGKGTKRIANARVIFISLKIITNVFRILTQIFRSQIFRWGQL